MNIMELFPAEDWMNLEEIRIRVGQPLSLLYGDQREVKLEVTTRDMMIEILNYLSDYSIYALEEEIRNGFFTMKGGHRVGVVGHVSLMDPGEDPLGTKLSGISWISGLNIRLAHQKKGCASDLLPHLRKGQSIYNTLILSSPGVGKTTYLRDCIRQLSEGDETHAGMKVGVVDERSEIAACCMGVPQNDLGPRTDVLDNCPKEQGMMMMLRSMSPQIIAVDELGKAEDFAAVHSAIYSGIKVLGTVHGDKIRDLAANPCLKELVEQHMIGRFVLLQRDPCGNRSFELYDEHMEQLC